MKRVGAGAKTIDEYLSDVAEDKRVALQKLRKDIRAAAPGVAECICYGIPAFRLEGKFMFGFGAGAKHCSFYPGARPIVEHRPLLQGYSVSKGTIRFAAEHPLPTTLVRKLVRTRLSERKS